MSDLQADVLRILRVFGPVSNAGIARYVRLSPGRTYRALQELCGLRLAVHPRLQAWDITARGRRVFADLPNQPLALFAEDRP